MKLYVLACNKLSKKQQFVQGTHAAIEYARKNHLQIHPTLVMLSCPEIEIWADRLKELEHNHAMFHEPYYNNKLTAIAATDIGEMVSKLNLI